jgi:hypothetical protein
MLTDNLPLVWRVPLRVPTVEIDQPPEEGGTATYRLPVIGLHPRRCLPLFSTPWRRDSGGQTV